MTLHVCVYVRVSSTPAHLDCAAEVVTMPIDLCSQLDNLLPDVLLHLLQLQ